jgi:hypothetical protein
VPKDLKLTGGQETFTIKVSYDTLELYGRVEGSRELVITSDKRGHKRGHH